MELALEDIKKLNIFEKMSCITNELTRVAKNLSVGVGKSSYKAVGEADVLAAIKPVEEKYRVYSYPHNRSIVETNVLTSTSEYDGKVTEKNQLFMRIETTYRFVNIDNSNEFIDITTYGDGVDSQDKTPGKAMTYADKYALLKAYKVETGDDPDQNKSEDLKKVKKPTTAQVPQQPAPASVQQPVDPNTILLTAEQSRILESLSIEAKQQICTKEKIDALKDLPMYKASAWIQYFTKKGMIANG